MRNTRQLKKKDELNQHFKNIKMDFSKNTYNPYTLNLRVFDLENGWGKVVDVNMEAVHPITVRFDDGTTEKYFLNGKRWKDGNQMLYTYKPQIV